MPKNQWQQGWSAINAIQDWIRQLFVHSWSKLSQLPIWWTCNMYILLKNLLSGYCILLQAQKSYFIFLLTTISVNNSIKHFLQ
jgi:hypothetical protein